MKLFYGLVIHSKSIDDLCFLPNTVLIVDKGKIVCIQENADVNKVQQKHNISSENVVILKENEFLMPGMIDTHIHAPQYINAGFGLELPLLGWLNKYTFPTEARFSDLKFANEVYTRVVANTLINGTTTAMYFATIHKDSALLLGDIAHQIGQRAFIGKVSMDQNSPEYYIEEKGSAIKDIEEFIVSLQSKNYPNIQPAVTPRFAITCSMNLMKTLSELASKYNVNIQTHVSENPAECEVAVSLHEGCRDYVDIYAQANLLTAKTILAHGVYLSDKELEVLHQYQTSISHCPNSNCSIRSGMCDVRRLMEKGLRVGLGTDVSGGFSSSILDAMRFAITVSNILSLSKSEDYKPLNFRDVFFMATLGGAQALGLDDKVGNFEIGKEFDALVVNLAPTDGNLEVWPDESMENRLSKWIHLGDDRSISRVYVNGVEVKEGASNTLRIKRLGSKRKLSEMV
ncbi:guanine deaminase-like isoform X1 [Daphnia magna]|uniref:guanine deaminase-like isoform X1 n=2 Tax=Daphnia magna TaxID=35525 RepID=UPI001E1BA00A|nr:guanine deaminase-like isoform X1 [Daphnia magna]